MILILLCFQVFANDLPFWTEKSSYLEGNRLYGVGMGANRSLAFENAKQELMNHLQISDLSSIEIHTQMTYEKDLVYRLVWVDYLKALRVKRKTLQDSSATISSYTEILENEISELEFLK